MKILEKVKAQTKRVRSRLPTGHDDLRRRAGSGLRRVVHGEPEGEPEQPGDADEGERALPSEVENQVGHDGRGEDCAHGGAAVEESGGEGAFLFGEPLGDDFDAAGPVAGLADAEQKAEDAEAEGAARESVQGRGDAPPGDAEAVAEARAQTVDHGAGEPVHDGVGEEEGGDHARVVLVGHVELFAQDRGGDAEGLAVQVVDDRGEEGQRDHAPAHAARATIPTDCRPGAFTRDPPAGSHESGRAAR